ncbi:hypothetical protein M513_06841 [Trichuris suis]|uniref:Uncharacterized protein n=1 Tax=Trichuris suis TaxID=68888 RepID=A0A085M4Y2_9BILA|nr:hypothetical protein M513_06841 [Trichuris suis]
MEPIGTPPILDFIAYTVCSMCQLYKPQTSKLIRAFLKGKLQALFNKATGKTSRLKYIRSVEVIKPKVEIPKPKHRMVEMSNGQKTERSKGRINETRNTESHVTEWSKYRKSYYRMVGTSSGQNTESQNANSDPRRDKRLLDQ